MKLQGSTIILGTKDDSEIFAKGMMLEYLAFSEIIPRLIKYDITGHLEVEFIRQSDAIEALRFISDNT